MLLPVKLGIKVEVVGAIMCAISCFGCRPPEKEKLIAEKAVFSFHRKLDLEQYREIYLESDDEFKNATNESNAIAYLTAVHNKLGAVNSTELKDWRVDISVRRSLVHLLYQTKFEQGGAVEEFTWGVYRNQAVLLHYNIDSTTLVTK